MKVEEYNLLVDQYADDLFRFALSSCKNEEVGKDIVQDTFERVWKKRTQIDFEKGKAYLFTTAYHLIVDWSRRENRNSNKNYSDLLTKTTEGSYSDLNEVLHQAARRLPAIQRSVLLLRDYEGYDYKEIAKITDLSMEQVKVYIFRARKKMKNYLVKIENLI